jgi:hypothetical protein
MQACTSSTPSLLPPLGQGLKSGGSVHKVLGADFRFDEQMHIESAFGHIDAEGW